MPRNTDEYTIDAPPNISGGMFDTPAETPEQMEERRFLTDQCQKITARAAAEIFKKKEKVKKSAQCEAIELALGSSWLRDNYRIAESIRNVAAILLGEAIALPHEQDSGVRLPYFVAFVPVTRNSPNGHSYPFGKVAVTCGLGDDRGRFGYITAYTERIRSIGNNMTNDPDHFRLATPGEIQEFWAKTSSERVHAVRRDFNREVRVPSVPELVYGVL